MDSISSTYRVSRTPLEAFDAINDVRSWWSGQVEGRTDGLDEEFSYTVPGIHFSRFRIVEFVPGERVAWLVTDSALTFVEDTEEWTGTRVVFEISPTPDGAEVHFEHEGLAPKDECFEICSRAWGEYIDGSLRDRIEQGVGRPNSFEGEAALRPSAP